MTWEFLLEHAGQVGHRTLQHVELVAVSVGIAAGIGVPLGVAATRHRRLGAVVLAAANIMQTIPSLALFGFLIPLPLLGGIGTSTAVVALVVYALLPVVRNTYAGITGVDAAVREAAVGMGLTDREVLRVVELPLAAPVILTGIRLATVIGVGIATIAAAIGAGGLGDFIFRGLSMVDNRIVLLGAVPAALLALLLDGALHVLERRLDWRRRSA
ncbi:MAG: ABC transporter permease [Gemmatimonadales bacterium]